MPHLCKCDPCQCNSHVPKNAQRDTRTATAESNSDKRRPGPRTRSDRRSMKICHGRAELSEPPLGAHLITPRRGYTHHGIYAGDGAVIHYSGLSRTFRRGPISQVSLEQFANGQAVLLECRSQPSLEALEILARARSRLGENRYRLLSNNCEHFSEWSRFGVSRSAQVDRRIGPLLVVVRSLNETIRGVWAKFMPRADREGLVTWQ